MDVKYRSVIKMQNTGKKAKSNEYFSIFGKISTRSNFHIIQLS